MKVNTTLTPPQLVPKIERLWQVSAGKIRAIEKDFDPSKGSPVFTVEGRYTTRGWTEWTQGFQFGSAHSAVRRHRRRASSSKSAARDTVERMAAARHPHRRPRPRLQQRQHLRQPAAADARRPHRRRRLGARLLRAGAEGRGAVQAARWTRTADGGGYIYSFNGPHSLFVDTIRSLRALAVAHQLGHVLMGENDRRDLAARPAGRSTPATTAKYTVYYGEGRDAYDVRGRVAHESIFNLNDGNYRCPNSQQGYSPFTTWTRGLAWAMLRLRRATGVPRDAADAELEPFGGRSAIEGIMLKAAAGHLRFLHRATRRSTASRTGTRALRAWRSWATGATGRPTRSTTHEPVDSSAAAIAAQGLLRLGAWRLRRSSNRAPAFRTMACPINAA